MTLFTYCLPFDSGAEPNPFWNVCTLAICKPVIRRVADPGDRVVATGSTDYNFENKVVYAMEVSDKMSLQEYDKYCKNNLNEKIPDWENKDIKRRVSDCIYDFSSGKAVLRKSVHDKYNSERDLGGINVLLSENFYYFGSKPKELPEELIPIVKKIPVFKSKSNNEYMSKFLEWIFQFESLKNMGVNKPYLMKDITIEKCKIKCSKIDKENDEVDERLENFEL